MNNCYGCVYKRDVPGNCHISCSNPDLDMTGKDRAIQKGWFFYPMLFDPIWATKKCANFEKVVSDSVSVASKPK